MENMLDQDGGGLRYGFCPKVLVPERWHLVHVRCWTWIPPPWQPHTTSSLGIWSHRGFLHGLCKLLPRVPFPTSRTWVVFWKCLSSSTINRLMYSFSILKLLRFLSAKRALSIYYHEFFFLETWTGFDKSQWLIRIFLKEFWLVFYRCPASSSCAWMILYQLWKESALVFLWVKLVLNWIFGENSFFFFCTVQKGPEVSTGLFAFSFLWSGAF